MSRTALCLVLLLAAAAPALAATQQVHVFLHSNPLHIAPEAVAATVGDRLELTVENPLDPTLTDQPPHDLVFEGLPYRTPLLEPGQSVPLAFTVDAAGTFPYYCSVPGHRQAGMFGNLIVQAAETDAPGDRDSPAVALAAALVALGLIAVLRERRA